jgi:hypothetical protein
MATLFAAAVPATVKLPPMTRRAVIGPGPSGSHVVMAFTILAMYTDPFVPGTPAVLGSKGCHRGWHWAFTWLAPPHSTHSITASHAADRPRPSNNHRRSRNMVWCSTPGPHGVC